MKKVLLLMFASLLMTSCGQNVEPDPVIEEEIEDTFVWEFSYTIDGVEYAGNSANGWGAGNPPAYMVPNKPFEEYDSLFFRVNFILRDRDGDGRLMVALGKKFPKDQMKPRAMENFYTLYQEDRDEFIQEGHYPFALDYERHYSLDGVALELNMINEDGVPRPLTTYSTAYYGYETIVGEDAQSNSRFEIIKVGRTANGVQYVEAEFHATVFGNEGNGVKTDYLREVSNGFVRFPITYMD